MPTLKDFQDHYSAIKGTGVSASEERERRLRRMIKAEGELSRRVAPKYAAALQAGQHLDLVQSGEYDAYQAAVATVDLGLTLTED